MFISCTCDYRGVVTTGTESKNKENISSRAILLVSPTHLHRCAARFKTRLKHVSNTTRTCVKKCEYLHRSGYVFERFGIDLRQENCLFNYLLASCVDIIDIGQIHPLRGRESHSHT